MEQAAHNGPLSTRSRTISGSLIVAQVGRVHQRQVDASIGIKQGGTRTKLALTNALLLSPKLKGRGSLTKANEAKARRRHPTLLGRLLEGISPIRTKHRLLRTQHRTQIGKPLLGLLSGKVPIGELRLEVGAGDKLKRTLLIGLIGKIGLQVGGLIEPLHILRVRDVEHPRLHPRLLIGKLGTQERILIGEVGLQAGLLVSQIPTQRSLHVELPSLKLGANIGLLTLDVGTKNIRSQLLAGLLGSQKLGIDALSRSQILQLTLTGSPRTRKSLARHAGDVLKPTRGGKTLTRTLSGRPKLIRRKLAGSLCHRQSLSLKGLGERRQLLVLKGLLIEALTEGTRPNLSSLHLTSTHALRLHPLGLNLLGSKNPSRGHLIGAHRTRNAHSRASTSSLGAIGCHHTTKLRGNPSGNVWSLDSSLTALSCRNLLGISQSLLLLLLGRAVDIDITHPSVGVNLSLRRRLHRQTPHLIQIATNLTPTKGLGLSQSRRHLRIGSQIGFPGLRGIGSKLGQAKLRSLSLETLLKRSLTPRSHIGQIKRAVKAFSRAGSHAQQGVLQVPLAQSRVLRAIGGFSLEQPPLKLRGGHRVDERQGSLARINGCWRGRRGGYLGEAHRGSWLSEKGRILV